MTELKATTDKPYTEMQNQIKNEWQAIKLERKKRESQITTMGALANRVEELGSDMSILLMQCKSLVDIEKRKTEKKHKKEKKTQTPPTSAPTVPPAAVVAPTPTVTPVVATHAVPAPIVIPPNIAPDDKAPTEPPEIESDDDEDTEE